MPRIDPQLRASQCFFTFSDGRRCRMSCIATGKGYCSNHARKLREEGEHELVIDYILQLTGHSGIASTNLTFLLIRVSNAVARGHLPSKQSNALLRIIEAMCRTIPDTSHEFARTFDARGLRITIRALYNEHEDYIGSTESLDPATSPDATAPPAINPASPHPHLSPLADPVPVERRPPVDHSPSGCPEDLDFVLKGRPLFSPLTPKDVDNFGRILEQHLPLKSPPVPIRDHITNPLICHTCKSQNP